MAYRVGLTGNIGCGKTTVGRILVELGAEYVDADQIVHDLYRQRSPERARIIALFGSAILGQNGGIDRRRLGEIVFSDPQAMQELEAILHPAVRARIRARMAASHAPVVVVDAIKLLETGLAEETDAVWVVTCRPGQQEQRLMGTRDLTPEEARSRIQAQPAQAEKVERAQVVIDNSGSLEDTRRQVEHAWAQLPVSQ